MSETGSSVTLSAGSSRFKYRLCRHKWQEAELRRRRRVKRAQWAKQNKPGCTSEMQKANVFRRKEQHKATVNRISICLCGRVKGPASESWKMEATSHIGLLGTGGWSVKRRRVMSYARSRDHRLSPPATWPPQLDEYGGGTRPSPPAGVGAEGAGAFAWWCSWRCCDGGAGMFRRPSFRMRAYWSAKLNGFYY